MSGQEQPQTASHMDLEAIFAFSLAWCFDLFLTDNKVPETRYLITHSPELCILASLCGWDLETGCY